jgi:hypothetical protein
MQSRAAEMAQWIRDMRANSLAAERGGKTPVRLY